MVVVHLLRNRGDQFNDCLGVVVTWGSLSSDHDNSWHKLVLSLVSWSIENFEISMNNIEDIHHLSLVLMNSLDLNVIQSIDWDVISSLLLNPFGESHFVLVLDLDELVNESLVGGIWHQKLQVVQSGDPLVNSSKSVTNELREFWVAAMNPSSWGNTICLILELSWIESIKFREKSGLQKM